jgi:hypothetical protein
LPVCRRPFDMQASASCRSGISFHPKVVLKCREQAEHDRNGHNEA